MNFASIFTAGDVGQIQIPEPPFFQIKYLKNDIEQKCQEMAKKKLHHWFCMVYFSRVKLFVAVLPNKIK